MVYPPLCRGITPILLRVFPLRTFRFSSCQFATSVVSNKGAEVEVVEVFYYFMRRPAVELMTCLHFNVVATASSSSFGVIETSVSYITKSALAGRPVSPTTYPGDCVWRDRRAKRLGRQPVNAAAVPGLDRRPARLLLSNQLPRLDVFQIIVRRITDALNSPATCH